MHLYKMANWWKVLSIFNLSFFAKKKTYQSQPVIMLYGMLAKIGSIIIAVTAEKWWFIVD